MNRRSFMKVAPAFPTAAAVALTITNEDGSKVNADVGVLRIQSGDVIVVKSQEHMTKDAMHRIKDQVQDTFPGVSVVVLGAGLEIGVIRKETA